MSDGERILAWIAYTMLAAVCVAANILEPVLWARVRMLEDGWECSERPPVIRPVWVWHDNEWWPGIHDPYDTKE